MKPRGLFLAAAGVCAGVVAAALLLGPGIRPGGACPAIGYFYNGDVELVFAGEPESVAA